MKLSKLKDGETFLTDTGVKFQVMLMTKKEKTDRKEFIKCKHLESGIDYFLENKMIIRKCNT